jgi:hypothetical protein
MEFEVFIAAVVAVISARPARASSNSRSMPFLFGMPSAGRGLSRAAYANGAATARIGTIHQKLVRGARTTHITPTTKRYNAACQLNIESVFRLSLSPRRGTSRLASSVGSLSMRSSITASMLTRKTRRCSFGGRFAPAGDRATEESGKPPIASPSVKR